MNKEEFIKLINDLYIELINRDSGESYIKKYNEEYLYTDVGYAFDGIKLFVEELKNVLKGDNNE